MSDIIPDSVYITHLRRGIVSCKFCTKFCATWQHRLFGKRKSFRKNRVEWNRKFTLSIACIVLFMIGAPLGSIIRKGGLGSPLVFAVIFFVLFHLLNTFGEKFAKQGVTTAFTGMWLSTIVLIPVGIFLTSKAMRDSQLFNKEFYFRLFKNIKTFFAAKKVGLNYS